MVVAKSILKLGVVGFVTNTCRTFGFFGNLAQDKKDSLRLEIEITYLGLIILQVAKDKNL